VVANNTAEGFFTASKDTLEQYYQAMKEAGKGSIEGFYALSEEERKAALEGVEARDAKGANSWAIDNNIAALSNSANLKAMEKY
jgi:hypothetical protein